MPIKMEDLLGARTEMTIVSARSAKVENQNCLVLTAKTADGEEFRYGILPDIVEKVLLQGHKDSNGAVVLKLPAPDKNKRINWVTAY